MGSEGPEACAPRRSQVVPCKGGYRDYLGVIGSLELG